ncbi:hypothetical protein PENSPDRAFT_756574 [Peniophora sp. CONT]|nr:hypothetical protein PENSPDRAFT_756574 [Peniophora sp. CONT]
MFPVTCNAFGDILAVAQLVRSIVVALDDARGATEEYMQFVHVLTALGTVMGEVYDLAKTSQNQTLRQAILEEVQRCCSGINSAHNSIAGFEKLAESSARSSRSIRAGGIVTKLHWHFLRASEAAKYSKRFGDSHQRLNNLIGLLSHQSTSQLLEEQRSHARYIAQSRNYAFAQSTAEIKAVAMSAIHQVAMHSRQQIAGQGQIRPFSTSAGRGQSLTRSIERMSDVVFDYFAPHTPAAQRERFLSYLVPFTATGVAVVIHTNTDLGRHVPSLWAVIVALAIQLFWLRSSMPMYPGFNCENAILLVDLLGEKITVPYQLCLSPEMFHGFLDMLYSGNQPEARRFVRARLYELYAAKTSQLISPDNWSCCIQPGACLEMTIVLVKTHQAPGMATECPFCHAKEHNKARCDEISCISCRRRFWQTREDVPSTKVFSVFAAAELSQRRHGTDLMAEISKMNTLLSSSISAAQISHSDELANQSTGLILCRSPRVHVVNLFTTQACTWAA